jgi:hypothetical protein
MELIGPTYTIKNTDGHVWQISAENFVEGSERVSFTVLNPRSDESLEELTRLAARRAIELLQWAAGDQPPPKGEQCM